MTEVWTAIAVGVLIAGRLPPSGIDLHPDPATGRPAIHGAVGNHRSEESCKRALAKLQELFYWQNFAADGARSGCNKTVRP